MENHEDARHVRDWFPENIAGLFRLSKNEVVSDLDSIHANISRSDRRSRAEHDKPTKRARLIDKLSHEMYVYFSNGHAFEVRMLSCPVSTVHLSIPHLYIWLVLVTLYPHRFPLCVFDSSRLLLRFSLSFPLLVVRITC